MQHILVKTKYDSTVVVDRFIVHTGCRYFRGRRYNVQRKKHVRRLNLMEQRIFMNII